LTITHTGNPGRIVMVGWMLRLRRTSSSPAGRWPRWAFVFVIYYTALDAIGGSGLGRTIVNAKTIGRLSPRGPFLVYSDSMKIRKILSQIGS
jgi:hypothetical protein